MTGRLTGSDREVIAQARKLAGLSGTDAFREHTGEPDDDTARAAALGEAQYLLGRLAFLAESLDGGEEEGGQ
jgi:hypothetical protein